MPKLTSREKSYNTWAKLRGYIIYIIIYIIKNKSYNNAEGKEKISNMIKVATLTRKGFIAGDISTVMSPRTVLHWADNAEIFKNLGYAFRVTFLNKCDESEKNIISEYYQRCFGEDLQESLINS